MKTIALDFGTSTLKVFSKEIEEEKFNFPSVFATRLNREGVRVNAYGEDALKLNKFPNTRMTWPVSKGSTDGQEGPASELIRIALERAIHGKNFSNLHVVLALPFRADETEADKLTKMLDKLGVRVKSVWYQAHGIMCDAKISTGIIVSIGQGTTEIMSILDNEIISEDSLTKGADHILGILGKEKFLDHEYIKENRKDIEIEVSGFADEIASIIRKLRDDINTDEVEIVISGGGMLIPGMEEELRKRLAPKKYKFMVPDDPLYSTARGMYMAAKDTQVQQTESQAQVEPTDPRDSQAEEIKNSYA